MIFTKESIKQDLSTFKMEQNIQGLFINPVVSVPKKFDLYDNQLELLAEVMNTWYNDPREVMALEIPTGCVVGNTKVRLLDNSTSDIVDLVGRGSDNNDPFYILSCNDDGDIVPGLVKDVWKTKRTNELLKVVLDDDTFIECTPDHRFMLRSGEFLEAEKLTIGQSLMPMYIEVKNEKVTTSHIGRQRIRNPRTNSWKLLMHCVAEELVSVPTELEGKKLNLHHKDHDILNDNPDNLEYLLLNDHVSHHLEEYHKVNDSRKNHITKTLTDSSIQRSRSYLANTKKRELGLDKEDAKRLSEYNQDPEMKMTQQRSKFINKLVRICNDNNINFNQLTSSELVTQLCDIDHSIYNFMDHFKYMMSKYFSDTIDIVESIKLRNHKVKEIIKISREEDVYDMEVDKYHNFAVETSNNSGVFIHNCGKSVIGQCITFLLYKHGMLDPTEKSIVLTSRKLLQSQYHKDFDYMMTIKGKANYICMLDLTKTVDKAPCNNSQDYECELKHNCDYYKLRNNIYKAKVLLPNYAWYLHNIDNYDNTRLGLQIFDEFHLVEDLLIDQFTIDIEALSSLFKDINDKYKYFDNSSITRLYSLFNIDDVLSECSIIANYLSYSLDLIEDKTKTVKDEIDRVLEVNLKIKNISSLRNDNNLSFTKNENKFYVTPLKNLMNRYFSKSKYNLLLTSTMNENYVKTNLCSKSMHYISRPSPFLVENRKIMVAPYFKVNYENLKDAKFVREFVDFIDSVIDVHPNVRGIIHTSSYQQVSIMLNSRHGKRLILNTAGSSINQLMEQFQSRPDSILVSPIVAEGYDFADDLARFGIITKIPFLNWNDPIRKVYGDYYYYQNSANKVVQQLGRTTRNHDDYSTNYILDENYNYLKSKVQLPQWLLDAEEYL